MCPAVFTARQMVSSHLHLFVEPPHETGSRDREDMRSLIACGVASGGRAAVQFSSSRASRQVLGPSFRLRLQASRGAHVPLLSPLTERQATQIRLNAWSQNAEMLIPAKNLLIGWVADWHFPRRNYRQIMGFSVMPPNDETVI